MRNASIWRALLCVENTVVEDVEFDDEAQVLVVHVQAATGEPGSMRNVRIEVPPGMTAARGGGGGVAWTWGPSRSSWKLTPRGSTAQPTGRRWRQVPWARHGAGHTRCFDQQVAWLATQCSKTAITELMRIAWRTVGAIITRVWADTAAGVDAFAGLQRVGIDEISYKRRHKYLTVVVDHDSGRLVWASPGRERATVRAFFDALEASGQGRCAQITHVSADGAEWIADVVSQSMPERHPMRRPVSRRRLGH